MLAPYDQTRNDASSDSSINLLPSVVVPLHTPPFGRRQRCSSFQSCAADVAALGLALTKSPRFTSGWTEDGGGVILDFPPPYSPVHARGNKNKCKTAHFSQFAR